jgi:hypothetical protein
VSFREVHVCQHVDLRIGEHRGKLGELRVQLRGDDIPLRSGCGRRFLREDGLKWTFRISSSKGIAAPNGQQLATKRDQRTNTLAP